MHWVNISQKSEVMFSMTPTCLSQRLDHSVFVWQKLLGLASPQTTLFIQISWSASHDFVLFTQENNMAAPIRLAAAARPLECLFNQQARLLRHNLPQNVIRNFNSGKPFWKNAGHGKKLLVAGSVAVAGLTLTALGQRWLPYWQTVHAASITRPDDIQPSRKVRQEMRVYMCKPCWRTMSQTPLTELHHLVRGYSVCDRECWC